MEADKSMPNGEIILYQPDSSIRLEVRMEEDTVWLTQAQMAVLFGVDRTVIVKHIGNIFKTKELDEVSTCAKIAQLQQEGNRHVLREVKYYNLDMIISVGFRVNSINATRFRQWATSVLKEYLLRGHAINQRIERLEQRVNKTEEQIGFFVRTALPPVEGVFFDGQSPAHRPLPHTAAVAFCGVTKMACLRHARGHIQASAHEHRFVGA